jgi:uncharacterized flavoprotein (TIGR03862 family)
MQIAIIGGGPAGLRAAEVAAQGGASVMLFERKASVGRKFLVAGRGGLNLTHTESPERFAARYLGAGQPPEIWPSLLRDFDADALRAWAADLGVETFAASTGRVFPIGLKAAPLLRRWVERLRELGVHFSLHHRWREMTVGDRFRLTFEVKGEPRTYEADAVILALGGGSWPETGSDGTWTDALERLGVAVAALQPANCGWELDWPPDVLARAEGQPLKNLVVRAGAVEVSGELLVTKLGLEGGAIYQLGPALRAMPKPELTIDFKPDVSMAKLVSKMSGVRRDFAREARQRWKLSDAAQAIVTSTPLDSVEVLAARVKNCTLRLSRPRPLAEAISSAGGVCWSELGDDLMLRRIPGVFIAGEMIDWEAPTGGYLIQGCLATGTRAGQAALRSLR